MKKIIWEYKENEGENDKAGAWNEKKWKGDMKKIKDIMQELLKNDFIGKKIFGEGTGKNW